jgi:hypothetical protein
MGTAAEAERDDTCEDFFGCCRYCWCSSSMVDSYMLRGRRRLRGERRADIPPVEDVRAVAMVEGDEAVEDETARRSLVSSDVGVVTGVPSGVVPIAGLPSRSRRRK